jgi:hypothetical protein
MLNINIAPKLKRKPPRKLFMYHKSDPEAIKTSLNTEAEKFLGSSPEENSVETNWAAFKSIVHTHMEKFIPHKMSRSKPSYPWINQHIIRQMRKRDSLFRKANRADFTTKPKIWKAYKKQRNLVTKLLRNSHESYKLDILGPSLDSNPKRFWSYIRSLRKESVGIPPLKSSGKTYCTDKGIAEALNNQFTSVFTKEKLNDIPDKVPHPSMISKICTLALKV